MGSRRRARETALQILYELEFNEEGADAVFLRRKSGAKSKADESAYAEWLVRGASVRREEIDAMIQGESKNWRVARMGLIDRNVLRLAVFEMLEEKTLVPAIVINEAVEIARSYSGDESAVFVNGVLDAVRKRRFAVPEIPNLSENNPHDRTRKSENTPRPPESERQTGSGIARPPKRSPKK
ncbi:MAG: transcription antitermination factor NusB [Candidatus Aminicenantes bacterium]|nr:transcription antitermination factor NusB [Candidatus Aminicenantes bacterium]